MLAPIDPVAEGTWIGVSDAPLAGILMNVYIAQAEPDVIPLASEIPGACRSAAAQLSRGCWPPMTYRRP